MYGVGVLHPSCPSRENDDALARGGTPLVAWERALLDGRRVWVRQRYVPNRGLRRRCGPYWEARWKEGGLLCRGYVGKTLPRKLVEARARWDAEDEAKAAARVARKARA